ncbi:NADH-ubiquinone oxidoreductase chain C [hydrothermal vent metagenome]|uniref:NADH-ubiquinone oxidoreductase chain C n=1 Tax=hydrothermal vent metagenome TaxID=652676 RepID=A0A3B0TYA7_9ZZZZ
MSQPTALDEALTELGEYVSLKLADSIIDLASSFGELTLTIKREAVLDVIRFLRDDSHLHFISLIDICGVDYPGRLNRFDVVYHLLSPKRNARIRIKLATDEATPVASITEIFPGANWHEREAYDFFGILFSGHPDLRRILTDYGFDGHPMRKDFPTSGYVEVRYDETRKRVVYEPVKLSQELRSFDYLSPWEGTDYALPGDEKANG